MLSFNKNVDHIVKSVGDRVHALSQLKNGGVQQQILINYYISCVRALKPPICIGSLIFHDDTEFEK